MATNPSSNTIPLNSATHAPNYSLHREAVAAADAAPGVGNLDNIKDGINMGGYLKAHVHVAPSGGANPSIEVLFWSAGAERFIPATPAISQAGVGADTPYEITVDVLGRLMFVRVSAIVAGQADIFVSGVDLDHAR